MTRSKCQSTDLVPLGGKNCSYNVRKTEFWYLVGVLFKISDDQPPLLYGSPTPSREKSSEVLAENLSCRKVYGTELYSPNLRAVLRFAKMLADLVPLFISQINQSNYISIFWLMAQSLFPSSIHLVNRLLH